MDCLKLESDFSLIRIFHAVPRSGEVDVYIDQELAFSDIEFTEFTDYISLEEGEYKIDIYPAGTDETPIISQMLEVQEGELYTVAATGNLDDLSLLIIKDYESKVASKDYSTFRIVHLSPNTSEVDVIVNDDKLFEDIAFREGTNYVDVNPDTYNFKIISSSTEDIILPLKVKLNGNRIYTIYIVGEAQMLGAIQSVDGNTYLCR